MAILSTETWGRIKTIAGALTAIAGMVWGAYAYAEKLVDDKIKSESQQTRIVIDNGFKSVQRQMLTVELRLIRADIQDFLRGKKIEELTAPEIAQWEELKSEQEMIKLEKRELDKLIEKNKSKEN